MAFESYVLQPGRRGVECRVGVSVSEDEVKVRKRAEAGSWVRSAGDDTPGQPTGMANGLESAA